MSTPLKPQFYVTRQSGDCVPLIAIDELPWSINLRGVPRTLAYQETPAGRAPSAAINPQKELFTSYTSYSDHGGLEHPLGSSNFPRAPGNRFGNANYSTNPKHELPAIVRPFQQFPAVSTIMKPEFNTRTSSPIRNTTIETTPNSQVQTLATRTSQAQALTENHGFSHPIPGKKEYCSYWLRHGECDYQQQGCLYRHEMPGDMATLQRLGLREIPRWYRELHNLGVNSHNSTASNGLNQSFWAPKSLGSPFSSVGARGKENWRVSSERFAGSRQSTPLTDAKKPPFSPPTRQFTLPAKPPSPPKSPTRPNAAKTAGAGPSTPPEPSRLGSRISQLKARNAEKMKAPTPAAKTIMHALNVEKVIKGKTDEPIDHLPSYPALVPTKKETQLKMDEFDEDEEMIG